MLALAARPLADRYLNQLRTNIDAIADALGALIWNRCDAFALATGKTKDELSRGADDAPARAQAIAETERRAIQEKKILTMELDGIKNAVLGVNGTLLAAWIKRAVLAYTDCTTQATDHYHATSGHGHVITSLAFSAPVGTAYAAVYELRRNEIPMTADHRDDVLEIMRKLFTASI